jgi:hypothetical protein
MRSGLARPIHLKPGALETTYAWSASFPTPMRHFISLSREADLRLASQPN